MFTSLVLNDHSERILQSPPQHCIGLADAKKLRALFVSKLPMAKLHIFGQPAGMGDLYDEKWMTENIRDHSKPLVLYFTGSVSIGQQNVNALQVNVATYARLWMLSRKQACETLLSEAGVTDAQLKDWYFNKPSVQDAINALYEEV
jgi:hypothetical protein